MGFRSRRNRGATAAAVVLVLGLGVASCSSGPDAAGPAPTTEAPPPTTATPAGGCDVDPTAVAEPLPEGVDPAAAPTLPAGVDTGSSGSGPGSGNPYLVPGARPVPGPDMPVTTLGAGPLTVVVAVPPNPDLGTPAATPADATTVPAEPTTLPEAATTPVASTEPTTTTTGLMGLADDPGCVASAGEP